MSDNRQQGEQVRREVMGDAFVDRALNNATDFTQPLRDAGLLAAGQVLTNGQLVGTKLKNDGPAAGQGAVSPYEKLMIGSPAASTSVSVSPESDRLELGPYCPATGMPGYLSAKFAAFFASTTKPPAGIVVPAGKVKSTPAVRRTLYRLTVAEPVFLISINSNSSPSTGAGKPGGVNFGGLYMISVMRKLSITARPCTLVELLLAMPGVGNL